MTTSLNTLVAKEHVADLRRAADQRRTIPSSSGTARTPTVELRLAAAHEARLVHALAQLDDARDLEGQALIALVGGDAVAALSLADQRVVANPFVCTSDAVALLRLRAEHLSNADGRSPRLRRLRLAARWPAHRTARSTSARIGC
jgi:hypothetical protein